jgi:hypothetical protein
MTSAPDSDALLSGGEAGRFGVKGRRGTLDEWAARTATIYLANQIGGRGHRRKALMLRQIPIRR